MSWDKINDEEVSIGIKFWELQFGEVISLYSHLVDVNILGMSNRLKPYNQLLGQVSNRVPGYSVENLFCSV